MTDRAAGDPAVAMDECYRQGYDLLTSPQAQRAFDIHQEDDKTRDAYGRNDFGQRLLLARRLVEAGVPFVTIHDGGWDHHSDIFSGMREKLPPIDQATHPLINDLEDRGLLDTTLIVMLGEFGRTPTISSSPIELPRTRPLGQRHVDSHGGLWLCFGAAIAANITSYWTGSQDAEIELRKIKEAVEKGSAFVDGNAFRTITVVLNFIALVVFCLGIIFLSTHAYLNMETHGNVTGSANHTRNAIVGTKGQA